MANEQTKKPVKPRGKATRRTDEELDGLTSVDALRRQLDDADEDWRANAPVEYRKIMEAKDQ